MEGSANPGDESLLMVGFRAFLLSLLPGADTSIVVDAADPDPDPA